MFRSWHYTTCIWKYCCTMAASVSYMVNILYPLHLAPARATQNIPVMLPARCRHNPLADLLAYKWLRITAPSSFSWPQASINPSACKRSQSPAAIRIPHCLYLLWNQKFSMSFSYFVLLPKCKIWKYHDIPCFSLAICCMAPWSCKWWMYNVHWSCAGCVCQCDCSNCCLYTAWGFIWWYRHWWPTLMAVNPCYSRMNITLMAAALTPTWSAQFIAT